MTAAAALLLAGGVVPVAYADEPASAPAADASVCQAVDWTALKSCIDGKTGAVTVNLTAMIVVPGDATDGYEAPVIATGADITLAAVGDGAGLTGLASDGTQVKRGGSVFYVAPGGSLTIESGTYEHLDVSNSGALVTTNGTLKITGGTFQDNRTYGDGGVIFQNQAKDEPAPVTSILGGVFRNNVASPKDCSEATAAAVCLKVTGGGGVIHSIGTLVVSGGEFDHNGATHSHFNSGGGAIWAQGSLTIRNGRDGSIPKFTNNWATVADPKNRKLDEEGILRGGAGGAVFLNNGSQATITGGEYTNNVSGYLGGAIYTEEGSTTYVGKAVATGNFAGHFGGGLWFCPSGSSAASKGGNIVLYNNTVNPEYDANPDNKDMKDLPDGADSTSAGADLAIMNPNYKKNPDTQFELLDTWFTDRAEAAVTWHWDGMPLKESSGYHDSWVHTAYGVTQGIRAVAADSKGHTDANGNPEEQEPDVIKLTMGKASGTNVYDTGLALKATLAEGADTDGAERAAQLVMKGNSARLSGGAFGSNGVVIFDSPYTVDWNKTDSSTGEPVKSASTWTISVTTDQLTDRTDAQFDVTGGKTPYYDPEMRPSDCQAVDSTKKDCWGHDDPDTDATEKDADNWYVQVTDNDGHDNNPAWGSLSIDNLAPGKYTLKETKAPDGYVKSDSTYTFTITPTAAGSLPGKPDFTKDGKPMGTTNGANIVNTPKTGWLEWSKTDKDNDTFIGGSRWKITGEDGNTVNGYGDIEDCVSGDCKNMTDQESDHGRFKVAIKDALATPGTYKLVETKAPEGYLTPTAAEHVFTIKSEGDGYKATFADNAGPVITNTPTEVKWEKTGSDDTATPLAGSEWKLTVKNNDKDVDVYRHVITDCVKTGECNGEDKDPKPGVFRLTALKAGTYTLTEANAPKGYVKSDQSYTFTITANDMTEAKWKTIAIDGAAQTNGTNTIVNAKILTALPLTGGRSAWDWAVTGGVLAILAGGMAVVADRLRRRAGVR